MNIQIPEFHNGAQVLSLSREASQIDFLLVRTASKYQREDDSDKPEDSFEGELDHTEYEVENSSHD